MYIQDIQEKILLLICTTGPLAVETHSPAIQIRMGNHHIVPGDSTSYRLTSIEKSTFQSQRVDSWLNLLTTRCAPPPPSLSALQVGVPRNNQSRHLKKQTISSEHA